MTGYGKREDRDAAFAAGFNTHLVKPADLNTLQTLLSAPKPAAGAPMSAPSSRKSE
jgi:CheY-like chemotaxis protein